MDKQLKILLSLKDDASSELSKFDKNASKTGLNLGKLGGIFASVFATGAIIKFGSDAIKAFQEGEVAMTKFNTTMATVATGSKLATMKTQLLGVAESSKKLGFQDEETSNGLARFAQITGDATEATKLHQVAMDLARAKGISYDEASQAVRATMAGNVKVLKDFGIAITDNMTPLQAIGALQQQVAGQAEAFSKTSTGQMASLNMAFEDLQKALGSTLNEALLPLITEFTAWLTDPKVQENLKILIDAIGIFLKGAIWAVKSAFDGWYQIITSIWGVMVEVVDFLKKIFIGTLNSVKDAVQSVIDTVQNLIDKFNELNVVKGVKSFLGNVAGGAGIVGNAVSSFFGGSVNDGVMQNGKIISTHPDDYLIATKNPNALGGGGLSIVINGDVTGTEIVDKVSQALMKQLRFDTKFAI
ncbi:MAG: hypothetical protein WC499_02445 [Patescibacteria group bacterium]